MNSTIRDRYLDESVGTAPPHVLLVRLFDRLIVDLEGAEAAAGAGRLDEVNSLVGHAQDIVMELRATLRVDLWDGGPALAQLYDFCWSELVEANVAKDAARIGSVRALLSPLRDAWREAASTLRTVPVASASLSA